MKKTKYLKIEVLYSSDDEELSEEEQNKISIDDVTVNDGWKWKTLYQWMKYRYRNGEGDWFVTRIVDISKMTKKEEKELNLWIKNCGCAVVEELIEIPEKY